MARSLAILAPSREEGGAERYLELIAGACVERGWSVDAGFPGDLTGLRTRLEGIGVACHVLDVMPDPAGTVEAVRFAVSDFRAALSFLRRVRPATSLVVLPHPDQAPGLVVAAALYRAVSRGRATASVQLVPAGLRLTPARRLLYRACARLGVRWLALSGFSRSRLSSALQFAESAVALIPNGVPADPVTARGDGLAARVRGELGLPHDAKVILTVGRLNEQKGYDLIADSIPQVARAHADARWVWAGEGPAREPLRRQLEQLSVSERVKMLGVRDDVPRLLSACDLFVLPSRNEGSPFAVLEALSAEVPVIVSDAEPLVEIVRDGREGRVVPAGDSTSLAAATSWALEHPAEMAAMASAGRRRVLEEFGRERMLEETLALLCGGT